MTDLVLREQDPIELTDAELDYISGGAPANRQEGLVNVNLQEVNVAVQALNSHSGITQAA